MEKIFMGFLNREDRNLSGRFRTKYGVLHVTGEDDGEIRIFNYECPTCHTFLVDNNSNEEKIDLFCENKACPICQKVNFVWKWKKK